ncbi:hypothetical protein FOXG_10278 [Fusarium oxysporum f. sp. lycopersici 4287]|uniref:Amino acid permease/ SLC12A domain-containing protein n=2 Tax=Fusarium oxysporum TaxID=5507 RepID=A0A0J9VFR8_FUSO4|nr:hypothetical protein FOXG_10278 [Fusarium oxysporum f. sp. lycopersici 4287]KNB09800.1 hypothetical protein FOXG_10278 [Fusarium oxysporum f. sp. lycopersici 4287]
MAFNHNKDEDVVAGDGPSEHNYDSGRLNDTEEAESIDPDSGVKRGLKNRHLSMMALAGIIGPGLLVGAGGALNVGGPAALLIGFGVVGWNYFVIWAAVLANEYNVICSILTYWGPVVPLWGYFLIFWTVFMGFQLLGVEAFGEAEFWLALMKLLGLTAYFIFAIIYAAGGLVGQDGSVGFKYWSDPGAFNGNGFRGVASVFVFCSTFYSGVESIAVAATETRNPGVAVPQAIRQVFWRIIFVYMGSAFFFGITCPANAEGLVNGGSKALQSPMTIAIQNAGWQGGMCVNFSPLQDTNKVSGVHLINAFILLTCLSAINSSIYFGSRTVFYMAQSGKAPKIFGWTNSRGVPVWAIFITNAVGSISMMNVSTGASKAYSYIVNLSGVSAFLVWGSICFIHIRFRRAWVTQGRSLDELPYKALGFPYLAWFGLGACIFLALVQGWTTLSPFNAGNFVDAYILVPLFGIIYVFCKLLWRGKDPLKRSWSIDLDSGRRKDLDYKSGPTERDVPGQTPWWKKVWAWF